MLKNQKNKYHIYYLQKQKHPIKGALFLWTYYCKNNYIVNRRIILKIVNNLLFRE